jgi:hypothetical protein
MPEWHQAIAGAVGMPSDSSLLAAQWLDPRYAARRIAWHVLEYAWEMQRRADS